MENWFMQLLLQVPAVAITLLCLKVVYDDLKAEQARAATERKWLIEQIIEIKSVGKRVASAVTGEEFPTEPKRPT